MVCACPRGEKNTIQCVYLPVIMNEISFSPVVILVTGFPPFPVEALSVRAELPVLFSSLKMFSSKPQIFLFFLDVHI